MVSVSGHFKVGRDVWGVDIRERRFAFVHCCVVCQISVIRTKLILYHQLQLRLCELVHWCFVRLV